jgi:hypothetical protein
MGRRVYLLTRDLMFRGKLGAVVEAAGAQSLRDPMQCDLAVIELDAGGWEERVRACAERGVLVLVFGAHVNAVSLRRARSLGAEAVPNSRVEQRLAELLGGPHA